MVETPTQGTGSRRCRLILRGFRLCFRCIMLSSITALALPIGAPAQDSSRSGNGYYTNAQAQAGKDVYYKVCAVCHGQNLQGGAGPALAGQQFLSVSQFQNIDAGYFYRFMSTHMPLNAPGSLSKTQYLDLLAYLLQVNGYASGSHEITADNQELNGIKIEPQH